MKSTATLIVVAFYLGLLGYATFMASKFMDRMNKNIMENAKGFQNYEDR